MGGSFLPLTPSGEAPTLASFFGPLELQVLESLWKRSEDASVRDLQRDFPGAAYTTLMTTLDRLYKKGVLTRRKAGRAYRYGPIATRERLESRLASEALDALVGSFQSPSAIRPLIMSFVDAVSRRDELFLDELEELIRARRREAEERLAEKEGGS